MRPGRTKIRSDLWWKVTCGLFVASVLALMLVYATATSETGSTYGKSVDNTMKAKRLQIQPKECTPVSPNAHKVLLTGGAGYIGSHTVVQLLEDKTDYHIIVVDNFVNSNPESLKRVGEITNQCIDYYDIDLRDEKELEKLFQENPGIETVIHFAGLKAVGESVEKPILYYDNNIDGTLVLLKLMSKYKVKDIVFSSSATVYGDPQSVPILEDFPIHPTNPYGRTKFFIEEILRDWVLTGGRAVILRYFNPVGAHPSGRIGEDPKGVPNNVMPYITQVAVGKLPHLNIYGTNWPTKDGTGVRDYIHVIDLADGHLAALKKFPQMEDGTAEVFNLGTGTGYSVKEIVEAMRQASGKAIPYITAARRPGDIATCFADPKKAFEGLGWKANRGLGEMARDAWNWQEKNPRGYNTQRSSL
eukprot:TRINITY_DN2038_c0_g1_i1.p1 TRINITY_DN2038_c0_g1~~TRINITY_DN2038_c0_g1_i1.p1  ORF type:complete len:416 (-),score=108.21 TRINITY_DN2038_c0_g1_i1:83-1330(-)